MLALFLFLPERELMYHFRYRYAFPRPQLFVRGTAMQAQKERWQQLCERVVVEQDPEKFMQLVEELNTLLEEKERRLDNERQPESASSKGAA